MITTDRSGRKEHQSHITLNMKIAKLNPTHPPIHQKDEGSSPSHPACRHGVWGSRRRRRGGPSSAAPTRAGSVASTWKGSSWWFSRQRQPPRTKQGTGIPRHLGDRTPPLGVRRGQGLGGIVGAGGRRGCPGVGSRGRRAVSPPPRRNDATRDHAHQMRRRS